MTWIRNLCHKMQAVFFFFFFLKKLQNSVRVFSILCIIYNKMLCRCFVIKKEKEETD